MKYSKTAFEKAELTLSKRREKSEREYNARLMEIEYKAPEIASLNRSLTKTNFEMLRIITSDKSQDAKEKIENIKNKNIRTQQTIKTLLKDFGYSTDYLVPHYHCNKCKDYGYKEGKRCECFEKLLIKYTTDELGENCLIELHDFEDFRLSYYPETSPAGFSPREKMQQTFKYCKDYSENFSINSPSLFLFGATGLGKTFLSSCIAKELLNKGHVVVFDSIASLLRVIENEQFNRAEGDTLSIIINAELVILDDLGSEFQKSFNDSILYEIINDRINLRKPTIVSTNLSMDELSGRYNERIVSRLTGSYTPLMFVGNDIRHVKKRMEMM